MAYYLENYIQPDFQLIFQSVPGLYLVLLPDLSITAVSDSYLKATKTKRNEILGKNMFEVFPDNPDDLNANGVSNLRASLDTVLSTKAPHIMPTQKFDIRRPFSEGGGFVVKYWEPINSPVLNDKNEVIYIIHRVEDVTERLKDSNKLDDLEEEKSLREQYVSLLSHDLKQPLSAIRMNAEMALKYPDEPEKLKRRLNSLLDNVYRTERMINDLLDANRIRAGETLQLEMDDCELTTLAKHTLSELSLNHGNRFELRGDSPVQGSWNMDGLKRLIENLCTNAVKYGDSKAKITVSIKVTGNLVELSVHNHGSVLSEEEKESIFHQFQRGNEGHIKGKKGWGLGLTLVRGIADAHGGEVSIESEQGKGTTFKVNLPIKPSPKNASANSSQH